MFITYPLPTRSPRTARRISFHAGRGEVCRKFPYVEGNRISKQNSTNTERELYTWDYRNRLTSVTQQEFNIETGAWETTQTIEYTYDYNNVWIRKVVGNDKTIFIPENYQTTVQIDDGTVTHHYLWTPNAQDKLLADTTPSAVLWSLTDHLGTIRDIIQSTESGVITQAHIIYDAYGNVISCKNSEGENISNPILFGYTGKAFDTSTQLQNNINRWYDSTVGRWLSTDPIGFEGNDTNLYRYVDNQVLLFFDTYGHESIKEQLDKAIEKIDQKLSPLYCPTCSKQFGITCKIKGEGVVTGKATLNLGGIMGLKTTIAIYQDDANLWSFDDIRKLFNKQYNGTVESAKKVFKADCGQKKIHYLNQNTNRNQPASITQKKSWTEQRHKTFLLIRREQGGIVTKEIKEVDIVIRTRAYATVTYTLTFTVEASLRAYHCC